MYATPPCWEDILLALAYGSVVVCRMALCEQYSVRNMQDTVSLYLNSLHSTAFGPL